MQAYAYLLRLFMAADLAKPMTLFTNWSALKRLVSGPGCGNLLVLIWLGTVQRRA